MSDADVDGATPQTFCAIGKQLDCLNGYGEVDLLREDYFLGTYYFNRGRYAHGLAGLTHIDTALNAFSAYRFHDDDPVFFRQGLRLTCRCGEELNGKMLHDPPPTRFTTYTWVYEW